MTTVIFGMYYDNMPDINTDEIWRPIKGFEEKYKVSNLGRVYSIKSSKILKPLPNKANKYFRFSFYKDGKLIRVTLHRLVAEAFIPNPENKPEVNHKDLNKWNCKSSNLEWVTRLENREHAVKAGRFKGVRVYKPLKLTPEQVNEIRNSYTPGIVTLKSLGKKFGVSFQLISMIIRGKRR